MVFGWEIDDSAVERNEQAMLRETVWGLRGNILTAEKVCICLVLHSFLLCKHAGAHTHTLIEMRTD